MAMALLVGLVIGFLMCIPIGPLNVFVINTKLKKGAMKAIALALGGSVMDFVYFFIIMTGLSFIQFSDSLVLGLKIGGALLIFGLGIKELFSKPPILEERKIDNSAHKLIGAFAIGVVVYTSNPTLLLTMSGLGAFVKGLGLFTTGLVNNIAVSIGLAVGSALWFIILVMIIHKYEMKISTKYLALLNRISGGLMIGLAIYIGHHIVKNSSFSQLIR